MMREHTQGKTRRQSLSIQVKPADNFNIEFHFSDKNHYLVKGHMHMYNKHRPERLHKELA